MAVLVSTADFGRFAKIGQNRLCLLARPLYALVARISCNTFLESLNHTDQPYVDFFDFMWNLIQNCLSPLWQCGSKLQFSNVILQLPLSVRRHSGDIKGFSWCINYSFFPQQQKPKNFSKQQQSILSLFGRITNSLHLRDLHEYTQCQKTNIVSQENFWK